MQTLRFADALTVHQYPYEIPAGTCWRATSDAWSATVELPDLDPGTIVAPSLAVLGDEDYAFQFTLLVGERCYPLPRFPAGSERTPDPSDRRVRTAIDCFHSSRSLKDVRMRVTCFRSRAPERYLLTCAMRPTELAPGPSAQVPCVRTPEPPRRSQMLENPRIANRICSPISTAMVLRAHDPSIQYGDVIAGCYDPATRMYGAWPLAIITASRFGILGAVELFDGWPPVVRALQRGLPLVASIRYGSDELPGAPQRASGGHLVVVHGLTGSEVLVNDPAAPDHGSVARCYPLEPFARAWFRYRGAAYILAP